MRSLGKLLPAIPIFHPDFPMAKHNPNHDPFEEVKSISLFISHSCETKRPSSPSLKPKPCPSGHQNVALDNGRDSTLILHDMFLKNDNFCAMDMLLSSRCFHEDHNLLLILVHKLFRRMIVDAYIYHKYSKTCCSTVVLTLQLEQRC
jgi:hypothetical protein